MKRFIRFTLCLLLCVVTLGLTACGGKEKKSVDTSIATYGNGGMVVTRGDYVYFVNGYAGYEKYTKSNLNQSFDVAGLYRAKLNDNAELEYDENGSVKGAEQLSGKMAGFETTGLYVFGNNIYFTTPTAEVSKDGELKTARLDFYCVNISGGKAKRVYRSSANASDVDFEYYYANGSVYLMVKDGSTLKRVNGYGDFNRVTVATDITSLAMKRDEDCVFESDSYKNIFYTKTVDGKVEIYNYNIVSNKTEYKVVTDYTTCTMVDYQFGHLYFKAKDTNYPNYTYYYRVDATKNAITNKKFTRITNTEYTSFYFLDNETSGYIAQTNDKTFYLTYTPGGESTAKLLADSKLEIMTIKNNYVYFKSDKDIKRINYYKFKISEDKTQETVLTLEGLQTYSYDIDADNLYVYATKGSNTYLYSISVGNVIETDVVEAKLLGVYNASDITDDE